MKRCALLAMAFMAFSVATGGASAGGAMAQRDFVRIMSSIADVESAIGNIRQGARVLEVQLVPLD